MSKSFVVITSIFEPTEAVLKFGVLPNHQLIVVGDKKSPLDWKAEGVQFLSVEQQEKLTFQSLKNLPYNHYCRKMAGYLSAIQQGAEMIVDTDDDNIPYDNWKFPSFEGEFDTSESNRGFVNIYKSFTRHHIWPRGFPLDLITDSNQIIRLEELSKRSHEIGIWQGLADSDPDVDAIYRLIDNTEVFFDKREPIVLAENTLCPFNSQNTAYRKELFPLLYLPCFVTFRFTDILRGLVAQPILWKHGYRLGFTQATVIQVRNPHSYMRDFESEIPCYLYPDKVVDLVQKSLLLGNSVCEDLLQAYIVLEKANIVKPEEIDLLRNWIADLENLSTG